MRESRLYGSEGGGAYTLPTPIIFETVFSRLAEMVLEDDQQYSRRNEEQ